VSVVILSPEELEGIVARAVEPLRREVAALRREKASADPVSLTEAARRLGCCTKTIRRRILDGELQTVEVGRTKRVILPPPTVSPG
jgi:excisionase family DNA binding protein